MPWTSALGTAPSGISKLNSVVKVCAGRVIAAVAHSTKTAHARFPTVQFAQRVNDLFQVVPRIFGRRQHDGAQAVKKKGRQAYWRVCVGVYPGKRLTRKRPAGCRQ